MDKNLQTILKQIKNERRGGAPHEDWVARNRELLMMQVRNTTDQRARRSLPEMARHFFAVFLPAEQFAMAARGIAMFVLALGVVGAGGFASAQFYGGSVPGDVFYKVKLAVERTQLALAPNDDYRFGLNIEFADHRIDEIAQLADGSAEQQARIPEVLTKFEVHVAALKVGLERLRVDDAEAAVEAAKLVERKMVAYHTMLKKASAEVAGEVRIAIASTDGRIDDTMVTALAVIVEAHLAGSDRAPRTVLVSKFESRIRQAEETLQSVASAATDAAPTARNAAAQKAIADAKALIEEEKFEAALVKIEEIAELTKIEAEESAPEEEDASADVVPAEAGTQDGTAPTEQESAPASEASEQPVQ